MRGPSAQVTARSGKVDISAESGPGRCTDLDCPRLAMTRQRIDAVRRNEVDATTRSGQGRAPTGPIAHTGRGEPGCTSQGCLQLSRPQVGEVAREHR